MADPAVQRTADRETIAEAMRAHYLNPKDMSECVCGDWLDDDMSPDDWDAHLTDAVLAVLVPADLIRAEALEAAATAMPAQIGIPGGGVSIDYLGGFSNWLRARAAGYRKAVGA